MHVHYISGRAASIGVKADTFSRGESAPILAEIVRPAVARILPSRLGRPAAGIIVAMPPYEDVTLVAAAVRALLPEASDLQIERAAAGVSTIVYRIGCAAGVNYLRIHPERRHVCADSAVHRRLGARTVYSGIIDFGAIPGAHWLYDLGHFAVEGERLSPTCWKATGKSPRSPPPTCTPPAYQPPYRRPPHRPAPPAAAHPAWTRRRLPRDAPLGPSTVTGSASHFPAARGRYTGCTIVSSFNFAILARLPEVAPDIRRHAIIAADYFLQPGRDDSERCDTRAQKVNGTCIRT